jgi:hypothetical protein
LKWDALFLLTTGGLIAADRHIVGGISRNGTDTSRIISDVGLYSTLATTGVLYLSGTVETNEHSRETGLLGFEAVANTLLVEIGTQLGVCSSSAQRLGGASGDADCTSLEGIR